MQRKDLIQHVWRFYDNFLIKIILLQSFQTLAAVFPERIQP